MAGGKLSERPVKTPGWRASKHHPSGQNFSPSLRPFFEKYTLQPEGKNNNEFRLADGGLVIVISSYTDLNEIDIDGMLRSLDIVSLTQRLKSMFGDEASPSTSKSEKIPYLEIEIFNSQQTKEVAKRRKEIKEEEESAKEIDEQRGYTRLQVKMMTPHTLFDANYDEYGPEVRQQALAAVPHELRTPVNESLPRGTTRYIKTQDFATMIKDRVSSEDLLLKGASTPAELFNYGLTE